MSVLVLFVIVINIFTFMSAERTEIFSSAERLRRALEYVKTSDFLPYLKDYVTSRKVWLSRLSKVIQDIEELDDLLHEDKFSVEIPTYAYKFIRRQALISQDIHRFMHDIQRTAFDYKWMNDFMDHLPNSTDLIGSSEGLSRLAQTYRLKGKDFLNGTIMGYNSLPLSAKEIFDIAQSVTIVDKTEIRKKRYQAVLRLLNLARVKLNEESYKTLDEISIVELQLNTYIKVGCLCSIEVGKLLNDSNLEMRKVQLAGTKNCKRTLKMKCNPKFHTKSELFEKVEKSFDALCRGDIDSFKTIMGTGNVTYEPLRCHLVHNRDPRLLLQPVKLEEVHKVNPQIAILHDVIRKREIDFFIANSSQKLERGIVKYREVHIKTPTKVSQQVFLPIDTYEKSIVNLRNRLAAATKLNVNGFEKIQVANYAAGGYYFSHFDSNVGNKEKPENYLGKNNRMVSMVMYLNDVEKGGETVFPKVGASISPIKGNAALFYNVHRNLITDQESLHGSCPIVSGEKWIATQWVSTFEQEFHRRCALDSVD